jgi:phosphonate transport system substrate-binding protein
MRDTDQDRVSHIVVKKSSGNEGVEDLKGKIVAVGAKDSPQATLIPLSYLQTHGLEPGKDFQVKRFDVLLGKHGNHVGGEHDAFRCLERGDADASTMIDLNWQAWIKDGTIDSNAYKILATTDSYDHCAFTVREDFPRDIENRWLQALYSMSYDKPKHREMMDMEGLKKWLPGRTTGYGPLGEAVERFHFFQGSPA